MPNWVRNTVTSDNWELLKEKFTTKDENGKLTVDFNLVIPIPKDLNITCGSYEWKTHSFLSEELINNQNTRLKPMLDIAYDENLTQEEFVKKVLKAITIKSIQELYDINLSTDEQIKEAVENIIKGYYNLQKYGYVNWYEAHNALWNTKWNACECEIDDDLHRITFDTAWAMPFNVYSKLSKDVNIKVAYADEDLGNNYGISEFKDGIECIILADNKSIGEAMAISGYDIDEIEDYFSEDNYTDEEIQEYFNDDRESLIATTKDDLEHALRKLEKHNLA